MSCEKRGGYEVDCIIPDSRVGKSAGITVSYQIVGRYHCVIPDNQRRSLYHKKKSDGSVKDFIVSCKLLERANEMEFTVSYKTLG